MTTRRMISQCNVRLCNKEWRGREHEAVRVKCAVGHKCVKIGGVTTDSVRRGVFELDSRCTCGSVHEADALARDEFGMDGESRNGSKAPFDYMIYDMHEGSSSDGESGDDAGIANSGIFPKEEITMIPYMVMNMRPSPAAPTSVVAGATTGVLPAMKITGDPPAANAGARIDCEMEFTETLSKFPKPDSPARSFPEDDVETMNKNIAHRRMLIQKGNSAIQNAILKRKAKEYDQLGVELENMTKEMKRIQQLP